MFYNKWKKALKVPIFKQFYTNTVVKLGESWVFTASTLHTSIFWPFWILAIYLTPQLAISKYSRVLAIYLTPQLAISKYSRVLAIYLTPQLAIYWYHISKHNNS
jgi:hypothetical protein